MRLVVGISVLSWFLGGTLLGLIEVITLPSDPVYSTILQMSPLMLLIGGIWAVFSKYRKLGRLEDKMSKRLRSTMRVGWFAFFAVDAGVASLNNMSTEIFHSQLPYYFQGVSLAQKIIALAGISMLGIVTAVPTSSHQTSPSKRSVQQFPDFWEKPLTSIGFMALLLGVVLGLAQYWPTIVFAGFFLLLAGAMLYPLGILTEKELGLAGQ